MAVDPKARNVSAAYPGGTVTGTLGLIEYVFGPQKSEWEAISGEDPRPGITRRRKYGTRQRSQAAAGHAIHLRLSDGSVWTVRVTGADIDFIDQILTKAKPGTVLNAWTDRGTLYGPQMVELA